MPTAQPMPPAAVYRGTVPIWKKLLGIVAVLIVAGLILSVLFGSGLGTPDDSRRTRHGAGFSISYPVGWGGTAYAADARGANMIRLAPERSTGRQTVLEATRLSREPIIPAGASKTTFQGEPARVLTGRAGSRDWRWELFFQRGDAWFRISIISPLELDWDRDPLMDYVRSFRLETPTIQVEPTTAAVVVEP